jgi:hypothetical protein
MSTTLKTLQCGHDLCQQIDTAPRFETSFDAHRTFWTVTVIVATDTSSESTRHVTKCIHRLWKTMEHTHAEVFTRIVRKNVDCRLRETKRDTVFLLTPFNDARRCLIV